MKKYQIFILLSCFIYTHSTAQYGERAYPYAGAFSFLTSGKIVPAANGFISAGAMPTATGNQLDFRIVKADANGLVGGAGTFENQYQITADPSCSSALNMFAPHGCRAVDIIPTQPVAGVSYAMAGVFSGGIFFATLNAAGAILTTRYWPTPSSASLEKPMITESATGGNFYICGAMAGQSYVIKINNAGAILWSWAYTNFLPRAKAIIESPYNPNELIVVGRCDILNNPTPPPLAAEAFFLKLNSNNGFVINFKCYSDGNNGDEWFNSIKRASSSTGGQGYIIGGRAFTFTAGYNGFVPWMIKLDPNGNVIWSTVIQSFSDIIDVVERRNNVANPNTYEYFGISRTPTAIDNDVTVWKLNDFGIPTASPNRFTYTMGPFVGSMTDYTYPQINALGDGTGFGDGLITWGTNYSANEHRMVKSYYNGVNGCENSTDMSILPGPGISYQPNMNRVAFIQPCIYFLLNPFSPGLATTTSCLWQPFPLGGSNLRPAETTGLSDNSELSDPLVVAPNPTNKAVTIHLNHHANTPMLITVTNALGQQVYTSDKLVDDGQDVTLDFSDMKVPAGLYFVNITANNETSTKKVMYAK